MAPKLSVPQVPNICMTVDSENFLVWTSQGFRQQDAPLKPTRKVAASEYFRILARKKDATATELIARIQQGLPLSIFPGLAKAMGITIENLCEATGIKLRTLRRRKHDGKFTPQESDRLYRIANLFNSAVTVFGGAEAARTWMCEPLFALSGSTPLEYCKTGIGAREVEEILGRIQHGDFS
jgi:putative toxin-antitoxin system antitoxin component (TIGR02293 family)